MNVTSPPKICLVPRLQGLGGMVSFQHKLIKGLQVRGISVSYDLSDETCDAVLVIGGTRQLTKLWRVHRQNTSIVQRLDGMNWLHRQHRSSLRHYLRAEYGNLILKAIRNRFARSIVYQSIFVRGWWEQEYGVRDVSNSVIYNGVDLNEYTPIGPEERPEDHIRLLVVEGNVMGGYEWGLANAIQLAISIVDREDNAHSHIEVMIVGRVASDLQAKWNSFISDKGYGPRLSINWVGVVNQEDIPGIDRSAHLLYSSDIHPACPNSVIEALACGTPVVAFDTGALSELVAEQAGRVVPYGGDSWKLEPPDIPALTAAAVEILENQARYRRAARARAERLFSLDKMVEQYLEVLLGA